MYLFLNSYIESVKIMTLLMKCCSLMGGYWLKPTLKVVWTLKTVEHQSTYWECWACFNMSSLVFGKKSSWDSWNFLQGSFKLKMLENTLGPYKQLEVFLCLWIFNAAFNCSFLASACTQRGLYGVYFVFSNILNYVYKSQNLDIRWF